MISVFFYLYPRKTRFHSAPGHVADTIDLAKEWILLYPVRVVFFLQHFAGHKLKAEEKTHSCYHRCLYAFRWFSPPLSQVIVVRVVGGAWGI